MRIAAKIAVMLFLMAGSLAVAENPYQPVWLRQLGTTGDDFASSVAVDSSGCVYMSGGTQGSLGGPNLGSLDVFLTKYDALGNLLWCRQMGTSDADKSNGTAVDSSGNIYIGGYAGGSLGEPYTGGLVGFLAKYDASGNRLWTRQIGTFGDNRVYSVAAAG
jgi:hypothetical protein